MLILHIVSIETLYCGRLLLKPNGTISSPNFPIYPYPNDIECIWKITTDPGKRIAIGVKDTFEVEEGTSINTCDNDWVAVYDGNDRRTLIELAHSVEIAADPFRLFTAQADTSTSTSSPIM